VASDFDKPDGITVVTPEEADAFIDALPIRKFFGVGKVTEEKMLNLGIRTGADLKKYEREQLIQLFGKSGGYFHDIAHGRDERPVEPNRIRKSMGQETTLREDIDDRERMLEILEQIAADLENDLNESGRKGRTVTLKIKYADFQQITRSVTLDQPVISASTMMAQVSQLMLKTEAGQRKVRLLGISISNFEDLDACAGPSRQLLLPLQFPDVEVSRRERELW
jgi:DNA polymerase-4